MNIVNNIVNDVALTILADSAIDPLTGLSTVCQGIATDGGVSVIDGPAGVGTVVDIIETTGSPVQAVRHISFDENQKLGFIVYLDGGASYYSLIYCDIPSSDKSSNYWYQYTTTTLPGYELYSYSNTIPSLTGVWDPYIKPTGFTKDAIGYSAIYGTRAGGLTLFKRDPDTPTEGSVACITEKYNTGWMKGDIRLATLSDTVAGDITSANPVPDRCAKKNPLAVVGTITKAPVATGAELVAYSGFSATDYIERDSADYADTQYLIGWEKNATTGWEFKSGVASTLPVDGVTITGTVLRIEGTLPKALVRLTATAPTDAEILDIYNQEKLMFREDAKCTLQGGPASVQALDYDELTDQLYAGTANGVTTFSGLVVIDHLRDGADITSVSTNDGMYLTGTPSDSEVFIPAMNLREEIANIPEPTSGWSGTYTNGDAETVTVVNGIITGVA